MRQFPASPITALIDEKPRYNLGESMGRDLTVAELLGPDGLASLAGVNLGYGTSAGDPALRALVAARHGIPDGQVLITAGAAAALFLVALLCGDGEVLVGRPCFPPMFDVLRGIGAQVVTVPRGSMTATASTSTPSPPSCRRGPSWSCSPRRRTPRAWRSPPGEVDQMLAADVAHLPGGPAADRRDLPRGQLRGRPPAASFAGRRRACSPAPRCPRPTARPGLRVGWLTVPDPALYEQLRLAKFNSSVCCGTLDEFLAAALLSRADQVLAARGAVLADARGIVERWIKAHTGRLSWLRPEAGAFCCMQLDPGTFGPADIDRFHAISRGSGRMVARGPWFGDSAHVIRVGLGYESAEVLERGLDVISAALEAGPR